MPPTSVDQYRALVQHSLPAESFAAFQLAFLRPFAVPRMADVLLRAGQVAADAQLRAYRTGLQMYEIIEGGFDSPRSRAVLSHINRAHASHAIRSDDFDYVLDSFIVVSIRHMRRFGWRAPRQGETDATVGFYRALGARLGVRELPDTYAEIEGRFDAYESSNVRPSESTRELGRLTVEVLRRRLPPPLQLRARALFAAQLDDNRVSEALGLPPASRTLQVTLGPVLRLQGAVAAVRHRREPFFTPGQPARPFPQGYELAQIL